MKYSEVSTALNSQKMKDLFESMYGEGTCEENIVRYENTAKGFTDKFGDKEFEFFTSPGRTEIGGNHTDHNLGLVLAGSIQMDCVACAGKNSTDTIRIYSLEFDQMVEININDLEFDGESTGTRTLTKGIVAGFKKRGYEVGGFDAYVTSSVLPGSGVSSSASYEMLICSILDYFFNGYKRDIVSYAKSGQYAENNYWLKGSGLLDEMACAVGGIISIDFEDTENPVVKEVDCDFNNLGLDLVVVKTGSGHDDLSEEYSSIPKEMKEVAAFFGKNVLREVEEAEVVKNVKAIREKCGDRALLRALHFFNENKRVLSQISALERLDKNAFMKELTLSGNSSWKLLQNCLVTGAKKEQPVCAALALTENYLLGIDAVSASRIHGGGFAGVIAVYLPKEYTKGYCEYIDSCLGEGSAIKLHIRPQGAIHVEI